MQIFYEYLIEADELIFIGYSLPLSDHDIRSVLLSSKSVKPHVKVTVILKSKNKAEIKKLKDNYIIHYLNLEYIWLLPISVMQKIDFLMLILTLIAPCWFN